VQQRMGPLRKGDAVSPASKVRSGTRTLRALELFFGFATPP
jgi:hypothetical protein